MANRLVRALGVMPIVVGLAAVIAFVLQLTSGLPHDYTWTFSVEMCRDIVKEPWFPTIALLCYAAGRSTRYAETRDAVRASRTRRPLGLPITVAALAAAIIFVAVDAVVVPGHRLPDRIAVAIAAAWLVWVPPTWSSIRERSVEIVAIFVLYTLACYVHTVLKALVFLSTPPADTELIALEEWCFGEPVHRYLARWAADHEVLVRVASDVYRLNASQIVFVSIALTGAGQLRTRTEFLSSIGLQLLLGAALYHVVPSYGPYYAEPDVFAFLQEIRLSADWYELLLGNTQAVVKGTASELATFQYVAAMPSLHVGFSFAMLLYLRRVPIAFAAAAPIMVFAWIATMILGWHYFVDGVFGILVAFIGALVAHRCRSVLLPARIR